MREALAGEIQPPPPPSAEVRALSIQLSRHVWRGQMVVAGLVPAAASIRQTRKGRRGKGESLLN